MNERTDRVPTRGRVLAASAWTALGITAVALLGMAASEIGPWYRALAKPSWQPPDWAFGPAWTLIYLVSGAAIVRVAVRAAGRERTRWLAALAANGVLNVLWSALFFKLRRPDWALAEVVLLWASILLLVLLARRHDALSALLLLPYLAWVTFAGILNLAVVRLNGPF